MSSTDGGPRLSEAARRTLLRLARASIDAGLRTGAPLAVQAQDYPAELRRQGAAFVTLRRADGSLRGCIGSAEAVRPLVEDVAHNAWAAAFVDPRFEGLRRDELDGLHVHISVLSPLEPIAAASEAEALAQIRPGVDGILVREGDRRGTLLPAVWEMVPDPARFLYEVRRKAGLPGDYWSPTLTVHRYTAESFD